MTKKIFTILFTLLIATTLFASTDYYSSDYVSDLYVNELYSDYTVYSSYIPSGFIIINSPEVSELPFLVNVDNIAMIVPVKHYEGAFSKEYTWRAEIFVSYGVGKGGSYNYEATSSFMTTESYSEVIQMICSAQRGY